jgi:hypothetical protein
VNSVRRHPARHTGAAYPSPASTGGSGKDLTRVDPLVVPPDAEAGPAEAAMALAATTSNLHAQRIVFAANTARTHDTDSGPEDVWETDGGHSAPRSTTPALGTAPGGDRGHTE